MSAPFNPAGPSGCRAPAPTNNPPVAPTTEGPCIAVEANAFAPYPATGSADKVFGSLKIGPNTGTRRSGEQSRRVTFRTAAGQLCSYTGKRGRVLEMLAKGAGGVTQWDCYPWHTRLGASIHAMRRDGLMIETQREGEYRHARYRLTTPGCLMPQLAKSDEREGQS